jgi:hypothetical protein
MLNHKRHHFIRSGMSSEIDVIVTHASSFLRTSEASVGRQIERRSAMAAVRLGSALVRAAAGFLMAWEALGRLRGLAIVRPALYPARANTAGLPRLQWGSVVARSSTAAPQMLFLRALGEPRPAPRRREQHAPVRGEQLAIKIYSRQ